MCNPSCTPQSSLEKDNSMFYHRFSVWRIFFKLFANCVVTEKYNECGLPSQEDAIFVGAPWFPMRCRARAMIEPRKPLFRGACDRHYIRSLASYPSQRERGLSRDTPSTFI